MGLQAWHSGMVGLQAARLVDVGACLLAQGRDGVDARDALVRVRVRGRG